MNTATRIPAIGVIVLYCLTAEQAKPILAARKTARAQRRYTDARGNSLQEGDVFPMLITAAWGDTPGSAVNGTVFLDGPNETIWVTSASEGEGPGYFRFQDQRDQEGEAEEDDTGDIEGQGSDHQDGGSTDAGDDPAKAKAKAPKSKKKKR